MLFHIKRYLYSLFVTGNYTFRYFWVGSLDLIFVAESIDDLYTYLMKNNRPSLAAMLRDPAMHGEYGAWYILNGHTLSRHSLMIKEEDLPQPLFKTFSLQPPYINRRKSRGLRQCTQSY